MTLHARVVLTAFPCKVLQRGRWALLVLQVWMLASFFCGYTRWFYYLQLGFSV